MRLHSLRGSENSRFKIGRRPCGRATGKPVATRSAATVLTVTAYLLYRALLYRIALQQVGDLDAHFGDAAESGAATHQDGAEDGPADRSAGE